MKPHSEIDAVDSPPSGSRPPAPRRAPEAGRRVESDSVAATAVGSALERARSRLLALQEDDGHWCGELEADSVVESEYIFLLRFLGGGGRFRDEGESRRARKAGETIRRLQNESRGWSIYPGGPDEVSASVKAYFALKLLGDDPGEPHMEAARDAVLKLGGVEATNTYTKIYLALLGQYSWDECPAIPPEMVLLPGEFWFNIYQMSSWSRDIFVPLSILWARRASRPVPEETGIPELFSGKGVPKDPRRPDARGRLWREFFTTVDRTLKLLEERGVRPLRERALRAAERWILERQEGTDGLGAILPGMLNSLMAFDVLGYPDDHPAVHHEMAGLERLLIEEDDVLRVQPSLSPVWDTAHGISVLVAAGVDRDDPALLDAAEWLLEREVRTPGDWRYGNPDAAPGGWFFQYANQFNPDCDDTTAVLRALGELAPDDEDLAARVEDARTRGLRWLLSMQNDDGGWAAFDRNCQREAFRWVPFADHNAMLDPSCPDITGRSLEALAREGLGPDRPEVAGAIDYLRLSQETDGSWYGRWGCNYIYGTWLALEGLAAQGHEGPMVSRGAHWLRERQNEDGGWGETPASYDDPSLKGQGSSTAVQTSWALLGLMAAGEVGSDAVELGIAYLLEKQEADGSWTDDRWSGTGFPRVFNLRYHLYEVYFPLLALATYLERSRGRR